MDGAVFVRALHRQCRSFRKKKRHARVYSSQLRCRVRVDGAVFVRALHRQWNDFEASFATGTGKAFSDLASVKNSANEVMVRLGSNSTCFSKSSMYASNAWPHCRPIWRDQGVVQAFHVPELVEHLL